VGNAHLKTEDRRILVVDDEESILALFALVLTEWGRERDISVVPARSAAEALAVLERHGASIDLIISDLKMPGMKGSDFLLAVKERYPDITTMIVSGFADLEEMRKVIRAGVFSYLVKPCDSALLTSEAGKALEVSRLKRENRRYEQRIKDELRWAGELQRTLLNASPPTDDRLSVSVTYLPLPELQCGGDYYDILPVSPGRNVFLIGDVGGHGIRAALVTAMLKSIVSGSREPVSPRGLLELLNERICRELTRLPDIIVTFLACLVDASALTLSCASAGHLPLFILRGEDALRIHPDGMGLGFSADARYEETLVPLARGDRIVMCTDGLVEGLPGAPSAAEADFTRLLLDSGREADFHAAVIEGIKRRTGKSGFDDDVALLSIEVK
jgi:sigma-B regulation protein RsbU (phosphoserine phosphatase)